MPFQMPWDIKHIYINLGNRTKQQEERYSGVAAWMFAAFIA